MNYKITILRYSAFMAFIFYVLWNFYFLIKSQLPPSILYELTGIPSPTTGMYRSVSSLSTGNINGYFINNPMAIPFIIMVLFISLDLMIKYSKKRDLLITSSKSYWLIGILLFSEIIALINY